MNAGGSHPQIEFVTKAGDRISYAQGGMIYGAKVGDKVTVLYRPEEPSRAPTIDRFGAVWNWPLMALILGAGFSLFASLNLTVSGCGRAVSILFWRIRDSKILPVCLGWNSHVRRCLLERRAQKLVFHPCKQSQFLMCSPTSPDASIGLGVGARMYPSSIKALNFLPLTMLNNATWAGVFDASRYPDAGTV